MNRKSPAVFAILLANCCWSCTTGPMAFEEVHYFAVKNDTNVNYFRLRVSGETHLGVSEYRSGWFPARSVDSLFDNISSDQSAAALQVRKDLENQINSKVLSTQAAWLEEAAKPDPDELRLKGLMAARRRILAYPQASGAPFPGASEIEFNPHAGVAVRYADEKLVFMLGSNPDEIIGKIANFAESDETVLSISKFSNVLVQTKANEFSAKQAEAEVEKKIDTLLLSEFDASIATFAKNVQRGEALHQIDLLLNLLNALDR